MAIVQEFDLNMIPDSERVLVKVNQYDIGTGRLVAHLYKDGMAYTPGSGTNVRIQGTKPDKKGFSYLVSISGNTVTADLTEQMTAVEGYVRTQIIVTENSGQTGTFAFELDVQKAALGADTDISETELPGIIDLARANAARAEAAADAAEESATAAAQSASDAADSASAAAQSADTASTAATTATTKAGEAAASATNAAASESGASNYATIAKSWAVGPSGTGTSGTDTNNSKYWAEQAAQSASEAEQYAQGGLIYKGSILFANIPITNLKAGDMYNMEEDFVTDSRFQEGAGVSVKAGTNIAWNGTKWDLLATGGGGGGSEGVALTSTVSGTSLTFTSSSITADSVLEGPYILNGFGAFTNAVYTAATNTVVYTLSDSSCDGLSAILIVKDVDIPVPPVTIKSFATATDAEITAMLTAVRSGDISYQDLVDAGWTVGAERPVNLSAMSVMSPLRDSHVAQTQTWVILHGKDFFDLADGSKNLFVVGLKNMLSADITPEDGSMNSVDSVTNTGGWDQCVRRTWCNNIFRNAIPSEELNWFRQFKVKASNGGGSTSVTTSTDWFTLPSRAEVFGGSNTSYTPNAEGTTILDYYSNSNHRIKRAGDYGSTYYYWLRSPYVNDTKSFCLIYPDASLHYEEDWYSRGLAPFGCL